MKRIFNNLLAIFIICLSLNSTVARAQQIQAGGTQQIQLSPQSGVLDLITALPASDLIVHVNLQRILNEALPRVLAADPARLALLNAEIDKVKTQFGIDPRMFEQVAIGMRLTDPAKVSEKDVVVVAQGSFDANALIAAGRLITKGQYQELPHNGKAIYLFKVPASAVGLADQAQRAAGVSTISEIAVVALNPRTLVFAVNNAANLRAAIDAAEGRGRVDQALVELATRNPNALISMSGRIPASATQNLNVGNEEITKIVNSIKQFYASIGTTTNGFDMVVAALTDSPDQAQKLSETLGAIKQFAPVFAAGAPSELQSVLRNLTESLTITAQNTEVQLRAALSQPDIANIVRLFNTPPAKQPTKPPVQPAAEKPAATRQPATRPSVKRRTTRRN